LSFSKSPCTSGLELLITCDEIILFSTSSFTLQNFYMKCRILCQMMACVGSKLWIFKSTTDGRFKFKTDRNVFVANQVRLQQVSLTRAHTLRCHVLIFIQKESQLLVLGLKQCPVYAACLPNKRKPAHAHNIPTKSLIHH